MSATRLAFPRSRKSRPLLIIRSESAIQVECGADQREMSERLRKISQRLTTGAGLFTIQAEVTAVSQHAFENQSGLLQLPFIRATRARHRFYQPERAHVESSFIPFQSVHLGL